MKKLLIALATTAALAGPAHAAANDEPVTLPDEVIGAWCFESKSGDDEGVEMLFTRGDCSSTRERSLYLEAGHYRVAYDSCTYDKVMLWLGAGPRDEPEDYHRRYQMVAACHTDTVDCKVRVSFYLRNDAKLGMWFLPSTVYCTKAQQRKKS
jgi:hypothetical protein